MYSDVFWLEFRDIGSMPFQPWCILAILFYFAFLCTFSLVSVFYVLY